MYLYLRLLVIVPTGGATLASRQSVGPSI